MKKRTGGWRVPYATLFISAALVLVYFMISGGATYVTPLTRLYSLGVTGANMLGATTYTFTHIGIKHLVGNLAAFIVFGALLEQRLSRTHMTALFVLCGAASGAVYAMIHPEVWVIGASAAIAGVLAAALVAEPVKTVVAFAMAMFFIPSMIMPATDDALNQIEMAKLEQAAKAQAALVIVEEQVQQGNVTAVAQQQELQQVYTQAVEERRTVSTGRQTEAATPASWEIHVIGAVIALAFLAVFDRRIYTDQWRRFVGFIES